jgi:hypothetical protein
MHPFVEFAPTFVQLEQNVLGQTFPVDGSGVLEYVAQFPDVPIGM